jgi:GNAT superfamily N-acetyltransferase
MRIVELFVSPATRHHGVGGQLIGALVEKARKRRVKRIHAEVHEATAVIERILETTGFDPEHRTMWSLLV